nr:MAG TPA: hypothetical protein [Bacteriophage sp.]
MKKNTRKSVSDDLSKYDYLLNTDENAFIEVTEWTSGEGYDIIIETKNGSKLLSLTNGELEAINYLVKTLDYNNE